MDFTESPSDSNNKHPLEKDLLIKKHPVMKHPVVMKEKQSVIMKKKQPVKKKHPVIKTPDRKSFFSLLMQEVQQ